MKLKKLIVVGFKSFADKVVLNFDDGITGIVGPNGSGKSNVIDAVRWVMGEQSVKHLRGSVATDIIFAGSDKRKPLGMAEVTLVFDNSEYSDICPPEYRNDTEISLTRRLFIDGQREYFINRKPCRLKDIVGFFSLTGLGGRSYSMIQQGQVDRILNSKPDDVRLILEEAAGTVVYKSRKEAAEKKLFATQENLSRLDDIVVELERQLKTLEGQVTKAKQYQDLNEKIRLLDLNLLAHNFHEFKQKITELDSSMTFSDDQEAKLLAETASLEAEVVNLQVKLQEADPELDELREQVSNVREIIARAESRITAVFVKIEDSERRLEELEGAFEQDQANIEKIEREKSEAERAIDLIADQKTSLTDELESLRLDMEQKEESAMVFRSKEDQLKGDIKNLELLLESNALRSEAMERDRKRSRSEVVAFEEKVRFFESECRMAQEKIGEAEADVQIFQGSLDGEVHQKTELDLALKRNGQEIQQARKLLTEAREALVSSTTRKQSLEEILASQAHVKEAYEKLVAEDSKTADGILCILTDAIQLKDQDSLHPSLVAAFDAWSERLLLRDAGIAKSVGALASQLKLPRLPLSIVDGAKGDFFSFAKRMGLTPLMHFITVNAGYEYATPLLERLYYLNDSGRFDQELLSGFPQGMVVFLDSGLVISSQADLVIESKSHKGALSRQAEIARLAQSSEELEVRVLDLSDSVNELESNQTAYGEELSELEQRMNEQNKDLLAKIRELQVAKQDFEYKQRMLNDVKNSLQHHQKSVEMFTREIDSLGEARVSLGLERKELSDEASGLSDESSDIISEADEVRRIFEAKQSELNRIQAQLSAKAEILLQFDKQIAMMEESFNRRKSEKSRLLEAVAEAKGEEKTIAEEIHSKILEREQLEEALKVRRAHNTVLLEQIRASEEKLKECRNSHGKLIKQKSTKSLEQERLKIALDGIESSARDRYQLNIESYVFTFDPKFDSASSAKIIQKMRSELDGLGAINMMAIEEFDKLKVRSDFIQEQKAEIIGSINLLAEAISEIEESARDRFITTFDVINQNFADLFPVLFPGGDARLHLTDENDPLNGGVDILVRLPGKKQRSMMLFSGGEKALTAISLIFALLKTKPTPFCFLDEVDAPLDEANVGRYNAVLEHLSERFQFIVITHNRRTMEVLDQLYGVTMQEGGVSKVVGVDLKKDLPHHLQKSFKEDEIHAQ